VLGPRRRKQIDYREAVLGRQADSGDNFVAGDDDGGGDDDSGEDSGRGSKRSAAEVAGELGEGGASKKAKKKVSSAAWEGRTGATRAGRWANPVREAASRATAAGA
jgi:hypothetical protein